MSPGRRVRMADVVRRRRTPRLDAVSALALLIPAVTVGVLALVHQPPMHDQRQAPTLTALTNATVVCPAPAANATAGWVSSASGAAGQVSVRAAGEPSSVTISTGASTRIPGSGAAAVKAAGSLAPGLLGLRAGTSPLTTEDCDVPSSTQWFTGLGAGANHDSVIELVNPDAGPADADITLYGRRPFTARKLHGITIPADRTVSLDLGVIAPRRALLSAQVQVTRGRLGVHVLDSRTHLTTHRVRRSWVPRQLAPALDSQLLGLPPGHGTRTLQLGNPGTDVVRVQVKVITGDTSFAPAGLGTISVQAGATASVHLTQVLDKALADGALGVEVTADGPVTSSLLTDLGNDLAVTVPDTAVHDRAVTLLPVTSGKTATPVAATLCVSADSSGAATVAAYARSGRSLLEKRVGQQAGHTVTMRLPRGTAYLSVEPVGTELHAAVVLTGDGASVIPLTELLTRGLVPQIRPGLS
jgi:Family of unknown function (DUF5719)